MREKETQEIKLCMSQLRQIRHGTNKTEHEEWVRVCVCAREDVRCRMERDSKSIEIHFTRFSHIKKQSRQKSSTTFESA